MSILAQVKYDETKPLKTVSLVKKGANKEELVKLADEEPIMKLNFNDELMEITGVVLIPEQRIYRKNDFFIKTLGVDDDGYIFFSGEDIKNFSIDFLFNANNSINLEHGLYKREDVDKNDVKLIESWLITTENDKSYDLGFDKEIVIKGTWMMTQKINNLNLWKDIKSGVYNSFSPEGSPIIEAVDFNIKLNKEYDEDEIVNEIVEIILKENSLKLADVSVINKDNAINNIPNANLTDKYIWVSISSGDKEVCPACKGFDGVTHTLEDWCDISIPGIPGGTNFGNIIFNSPHGNPKFGTYCESVCRCELRLI